VGLGAVENTITRGRRVAADGGGANNGNRSEQIPTAGSQHSADYSRLTISEFAPSEVVRLSRYLCHHTSFVAAPLLKIVQAMRASLLARAVAKTL